MRIFPNQFYEILRKYDVEFFSGVPDSLLKSICSYIDDIVEKKNHIIAVNEGNAVGIGIGYHLGTGKVPLIYMQNSGLGNAVNPLLSLADRDVYSIPMLLMIGWRGCPGVKDEPQHKKQGRVMIDMLDAMEVPYEILDDHLSLSQVEDIVKDSLEKCKSKSGVRALVIKKGFFEDYISNRPINNVFKLSRERAIHIVADCLNRNDVVVSTTGFASRELYEYRELKKQNHNVDFLTVGGMGHANQIALGVSSSCSHKRVICLDGDGSVLMHMGSMALISSIAPSNYLHVLLNNGAHDSVGGQDTVALDVDMAGVAKSVGYKAVYSLYEENELRATLLEIEEMNGPIFLEIKVNKGCRESVGRPRETPIENKKIYMGELLE